MGSQSCLVGEGAGKGNMGQGERVRPARLGSARPLQARVRCRAVVKRIILTDGFFEGRKKGEKGRGGEFRVVYLSLETVDC